MGESQGVFMFGFGNNKRDHDSGNQKNESVPEKDATRAEGFDNGEQGMTSSVQNACSDELALIKEKFIRLGADFQNYKKRVEKDRLEWMDKSKADVLAGMLTVVDNFDRALDEAKHVNNEQLSEWLKGFELIHKVFYEFLKDQGVEPVSQNEVFDPTYHEAIAQLESPSHQSGQIIDLFEKGFLYKGKVLRTAKVTVAK